MTIDAQTLGGFSLDEIVALITNAVDIGIRQSGTRPPAPRHELTSTKTGTVIGIDADSVQVHLDEDDPGVTCFCSPNAAAAPGQRGTILFAPNGSAKWIGGSVVTADDSGGPVQIPPATPYQAYPAGALANGTLKAAWSAFPGTPFVFFSIDIVWGSATGIGAFRLPTLPVARRQWFAGGVVVQPASTEYGLVARTVVDGSSVALTPLRTDNGQVWTSLALGTGSRLSVTGVYEAAQ